MPQLSRPPTTTDPNRFGVDFELFSIEKSQRVKTQRAKTSKTSRKKKMFAEDISEDSEDISLLDFKVFLDIFEIFAEDCFLLRSFRKFLFSGFLPLSRFQFEWLTTGNRLENDWGRSWWGMSPGWALAEKQFH